MLVGDLRHNGVNCCRRPIDGRDEHLDDVTEGDDRDETADDQLDRPESALAGHEYPIDDHSSDRHADQQGDVKEQRESDAGTDEFREIGRHRRNFADYPHREGHRQTETLAAELGEIAAGDDSELCGQRLEQHCDQIRKQHRPQEAISVFGAGLDVGREIAGIDESDRDDDGGTGESRIAAPPAALAIEHVTSRLDCPFCKGHQASTHLRRSAPAAPGCFCRRVLRSIPPANAHST